MVKKTVILLLVIILLPVQALACTAVYAGSGLTEDGSTMFARLEEFGSDEGWPKLFDVIPEGAHRAGEAYTGCYGFTWTFTHDSYGYTAFCDNNSQGVCPDCEGTHPHTPYQAAGTNSKGVSVTATETLVEKPAILAVDPLNTESGIEEAEIPTILLSEASSAREAMTLLTSIYATVGSFGGAGVIVGDADETWYIESISGSQYIAVRLNRDMLFVCPNISVIGLVDLHDTENVVASDKLIETAVEAGTFVGDVQARRIDFAASYDNAPDSAYIRLAAALNDLSGNTIYPLDLTPEGIEGSAFRISNVDAEEKIVPLYTNIQRDKKLSLRDVMGLYQLDGINRGRSLDTHIFQITDSTGKGTLEWVSMADNRTSVFIPYLPMMTEEVFVPFHAATGMPVITEEKPSQGLSYATSAGWGTYPEGWQDSWYWVFARLEHIAREDQAAAQLIREAMDDLQDEICASGEIGNAAAEKAWRRATELLNIIGN